MLTINRLDTYKAFKPDLQRLIDGLGPDYGRDTEVTVRQCRDLVDANFALWTMNTIREDAPELIRQIGEGFLADIADVDTEEAREARERGVTEVTAGGVALTCARIVAEQEASITYEDALDLFAQRLINAVEAQ